MKNNLWNRKGQLFRETGKLISDQNEIAGFRTVDFQEATWMQQAYCAKKLIASPTPKPTARCASTPRPSKRPHPCRARSQTRQRRWNRLHDPDGAAGERHGFDSTTGWWWRRWWRTGTRTQTAEETAQMEPPHASMGGGDEADAGAGGHRLHQGSNT